MSEVSDYPVVHLAVRKIEKHLIELRKARDNLRAVGELNLADKLGVVILKIEELVR